MVGLRRWASSGVADRPGGHRAFDDDDDHDGGGDDRRGSPAGAPGGCDAAYPDVCIPVTAADLDCNDVAYRRFRVVGADRHHFDGDHDGIGCQSA